MERISRLPMKYYVLIPLAMVSAILMALAFPTKNLWILAFVTFVPLFMCVYNGETKKTILMTVIFCAVFFIIHLLWVASWLARQVPTPIALAAVAGIVAILIGYYTVAALLAQFLSQRIPRFRPLIVAIIFTILEYLRTLGVLGFPWGNSCYSQSQNLYFIQIADTVGGFGVSFMLFLVNAVIADGIIKYRAVDYGFKKTYLRFPRVIFNSITLAVVCVLGAYMYGAITLSNADATREALPFKRVGIVQHATDPNSEWRSVYTGKPPKPSVKIGPVMIMDTGKIAYPEPPDGSTLVGALAATRMIRLAEETLLDTKEIVNGKEVERGKPSLIIYPESAMLDPYRYYLPRVKRSARDVAALRDTRPDLYTVGLLYNAFSSMGVTHLLGSPDYALIGYDESGRPRFHSYNAAMLVTKNGEVVQEYAKMRLVPFGEVNPIGSNFILRNVPVFKSIIGWYDGVLEASGAAGWTPGPERAVFKHPTEGYTFSALVCYEGAFGDHTRKFVKLGAEGLVNVTDDAWSYSDASLEEHFSMSIFRAIENRRDLLRSANTGISAHIDSYGRVVERLPAWEPGSMTVSFVPQKELTVYSKYGEWFVFVLAAILLLIVDGYYAKTLAAYLRARKQ